MVMSLPSLKVTVFFICLCFNMVSFRGQKKLGPRPDRSPLGLLFKTSDEHPHPFHMRSPPPTPPGLDCCIVIGAESGKVSKMSFVASPTNATSGLCGSEHVVGSNSRKVFEASTPLPPLKTEACSIAEWIERWKRW